MYEDKGDAPRFVRNGEKPEDKTKGQCGLSTMRGLAALPGNLDRLLAP